MTGPEQLPLDLAHRPAQGRDDFLVSGCNRTALDAITDWTDWPDGRLALTGPEGAGKSHLASIWGQSTGGVRLAADELTEQRLRSLMLERAVVVEDVPALARLPGPAQRQCETALFHLFNHAGAEGISLLLTGRGAPGHWPLVTPDLVSRVSAMAHVAILPPDDILLSQVLHKLFADRQLQVGPDVIQYLVVRMERSFAVAERLVERLDQMALAQRRRITRPLAVELYAEEVGDLPDQEED